MWTDWKTCSGAEASGGEKTHRRNPVPEENQPAT